MIKLVAAEKQPLEVEAGQRVIDSGDRLRHPIIVSVLRLEGECEIRLLHGGKPGGKASGYSAIGSNPEQRRTAVRNQAQRYVVALKSRLRRAKDSSHKFIVKKRGTQRELGLLQAEKAVMVPRRLAKHGKRKRVSLKQSVISYPGAVNMGQEIRTIQSGRGIGRPEGTNSAKHFSTVIAGHAARSEWRARSRISREHA